MFEKLRRPAQPNRYAETLLGAGIILLSVLQKDLIRPIDSQLLAFLALGLLAYTSLWRGRQTIVGALTSGLILGLLVHSLIATGGVDTIGRFLKEGPKHLADDIHDLAFDRGLLVRARALQFSKARFSQFPEEQSAVARLRTLSPGVAAPTVFVLTDDPVVYILTGQAHPVFHANMYNASPIYEQKRVVRWLNDDKPQFVLFDQNALDFDGFPKVVRSPIVFNAVIQSYVPLETAGRLEVLRRRQVNEPVAMAYWQQKLGPATNFGHLAALSSFDRFSPCHSQSERSCREFLEVTLPENFFSVNKFANNVTIPFEVSGLPFAVVMDVFPGRTKYYLLLSRFWPWAAAEATGLSRRIAEDKVFPGVKASVTSRAVTTEVLY